MFSNLPLFIGLRYSKAKRRNGFISFISLISIIGIALGVWALITVMSIMNGFEKELRGRILDVAAHVSVTGQTGWLYNGQAISDQIEVTDKVIGKAPYILGQGLISKGSAVNGALVRGIDPEQEIAVSGIHEYMTQGDFKLLAAGEYNVIIGEELAYKLGVGVGSKITIIAPKGQATAAGFMPRLRRFNVVGIFNLNMYEYDSTLVLTHIQDAAKLYKTEDKISGIRLKLADVYQAPIVRNELAKALGWQYQVSDWTRQHENFFRALAIEKRVMFIILFLIVAVAAFNIVSTLVMVVNDKQADIAILRTQGLSPKGVMGIFFIQGVNSGVIGTFFGAVTGVITALNIDVIVPWLENLFGFQFFPADVYVISKFPAELHWDDVIMIVIAALGMSMVATLYPAWRASKTQPAEALRYE